MPYADPDRRKAYYLEWQRKNREKVRAYQNKWREENRDRVYEYHRRYFEKNREKVYAAQASNKAVRRDRIMGTKRIRRDLIFKRDGGRCHICGKQVPVTDYHLDHLVPISRGGSHTPDNVAIAHSKCNMRRGAGRTPAQLRLIG